MTIDNLTISTLKQILPLLNGNAGTNKPGNEMIGHYVIVRTYSAGVHAGTLDKKCGNEVVLKSARRLDHFFCASGDSLSAVATVGIKPEKGRISATVGSIWLEAIEIIPTTDKAMVTITKAPVYEPS